MSYSYSKRYPPLFCTCCKRVSLNLYRALLYLCVPVLRTVYTGSDGVKCSQYFILTANLAWDISDVPNPCRYPPPPSETTRLWHILRRLSSCSRYIYQQCMYVCVSVSLTVCFPCRYEQYFPSCYLPEENGTSGCVCFTSTKKKPKRR